MVALLVRHAAPPCHSPRPNPSSIPAIAASRLLQLSALATEEARRGRYSDYARRILDTLLTPEFVAVETPGWEGILKHGSYHERLGLGVDESVMWGEYFFCEALDKLLGAPLAG